MIQSLWIVFWLLNNDLACFNAVNYLIGLIVKTQFLIFSLLNSLLLIFQWLGLTPVPGRSSVCLKCSLYADSSSFVSESWKYSKIKIWISRGNLWMIFWWNPFLTGRASSGSTGGRFKIPETGFSSPLSWPSQMFWLLSHISQKMEITPYLYLCFKFVCNSLWTMAGGPFAGVIGGNILSNSVFNNNKWFTFHCVFFLFVFFFAALPLGGVISCLIPSPGTTKDR